MSRDITQILKKIETGDQHAAGELLPLVYEELRKLAAHKMSQEKAGQTLQPTALVHEAFMRLIGNSLLAPNDRLEAYPTKELTGGTLL